jgi:hypothetical protein
MTDEPFDERPWGEEEWERFMQESDAKSARFGELLETLRDHPDCDEIIRREMGWDKGDETGSDDDEESDNDLDDWKAEAIAAMNEPPSEEVLEEVRRDQDELENLPAYRRSFDWSMRVHEALKESFGELEGDLEELVGEAVGDSHMVAAKIAGGHGMGYEDESICGNIVCCKRSLEAAKRSLAALSELQNRHPPLAGSIAPLLEEGEEVQRLVEDHIAELRGRVWWE